MVTLKYFDPQAPIVIECDASGVCVGGVLLQHGQPVTFISQVLTETQKCYSNIERELLAVVIVIEHLHHFVFGRQFTVNTDHAPLVNLFEKCLNDTSPHLQRLLLRLSQYVQYVTSKCVLIGNCLSHLIDHTSAREDESLNLQIANLGVEPVKIDWQNIRTFTMVDPTLVHLAKTIQNGWPETGKELEGDVKPYFQHRYELHIVDGIIFFQNRIVVPIGIKHQFLAKLHESHMGVVKSKLLARTLVYWPKWNEDIKQVCVEYETYRENQHMPPNIPKFQVNVRGPGEVYGCDVAEIAGKQHTVIVDYNSCCIFEQKLKCLASVDVINALKDIFCGVGTPDRLVSDNARYFTSEEFHNFMMDWSIHHITLSPRYPQGNGMAEKAVNIVKELYAKCDDVKLGLLLMKTTPVTGEHHRFQAPANVFFGRALKANLPIYHQNVTCTLDTENSAKIEIGDSLSKFQINQDVWVKVDPNTKWMAGKISKILPNQSYKVELSDGCVFRRNQHHITKRQSCLKPSMNSEATPESHSYNLRSRKISKSVKWPDIPAEGTQGTMDFELPSDF